MSKTFCYWTVADGKHGPMASTMVASARAVGVTADFHIWTDMPAIEGATVHPCGAFDKKLYMFKFHFLKDEVSKLNYDYFVFLDADNYFVRNPGDLAEMMGEDKIFAQMENIVSDKSARRDWWGCPVTEYGKFLREQGADCTVYYNTNAGFWVVAKTAVDEFYAKTTMFFAKAQQRGYTNFTEEPALAFAGHVMQDPSKRTLEDTSWLWCSDWTGQWKDKLPTYMSWQFEDYMSGEKKMVKPCITHAMRSKDALIAAYRKPQGSVKPTTLKSENFEVLMCCYGDFADVSNRTIDAILATKTKDFKIRVALNSCGKKTKEHYRKLLDDGKIESLLEFNSNINKDPAMRKLIDSCEADYFLWLDDDTYPIKEGWDTVVCDSFVKETYDVGGFTHVSGRGGYVGYKKFLEQRPWFKSWDKYKEYGDPNFDKDNIPFPIGFMWTGRKQFFVDNNFPDIGMIKKCDDMLMGELIYQANGKFKHLGDLWNYFERNKADRRGNGEEAHDGWKMLSEKKFDGLTIYPTGGMCNRMRNFISAYELCKEKNTKLKYIHEVSENLVAGIKFNDYWDIPVDVVYENATTSEIMDIHNREIANSNVHRKLPFLNGAYHNHWGLCVMDNENIDTQGLGRLKKGLTYALPLKKKWQDMIDKFVINNNIGTCVGVHMRSFEFLFGDRSPPHHDKLISHFIESIGNVNKIFLATDSREVQERMQKHLGNSVVVYKSIIGKDYLERTSVEDFETGLMDFYILSRCRKVLGTKGSSYSHLAGLLCGNLEWVIGSQDAKEWDG
jgi:hypothetical protein